MNGKHVLPICFNVSFKIFIVRIEENNKFDFECNNFTFKLKKLLNDFYKPCY